MNVARFLSAACQMGVKILIFTNLLHSDMNNPDERLKSETPLICFVWTRVLYGLPAVCFSLNHARELPFLTLCLLAAFS